MKVYLDTSAWVKRYLHEVGTPLVDRLFDDTPAGLSASFWNLGEALGVLDRRCGRGDYSRRRLTDLSGALLGETLSLVETGRMDLHPVSAELLARAWPTLLRDHLYQADALQMETCRESESDILLTADRALSAASRRAGIRALNPEEERDRRELERML
ncbi:MAG: type II toxin-antitoxin system VapC family toxin [Euryarchaeota archaeon]|nr:type II toxin-antitoxin system VapC family toxin [Euryarchaeota archaeon]